jgi:flagellar protein FliS
MFAPHRSFAGSYHRVQVETGVEAADPHRLVTMLFDGALAAITAARGALARGDVGDKGLKIGKAVRIVEEGLRGGLNKEAGGELAERLDALYRYITQRLTLANLRNDDAVMKECFDLLSAVRDGWVHMNKPSE